MTRRALIVLSFAILFSSGLTGCSALRRVRAWLTPPQVAPAIWWKDLVGTALPEPLSTLGSRTWVWVFPPLEAHYARMKLTAEAATYFAKALPLTTWSAVESVLVASEPDRGAMPFWTPEARAGVMRVFGGARLDAGGHEWLVYALLDDERAEVYLSALEVKE